MLQVEKYESKTFKMLTAVSCLVNSINMELCEHSYSVPQSDSHENHGIGNPFAALIALARLSRLAPTS